MSANRAVAIGVVTVTAVVLAIATAFAESAARIPPDMRLPRVGAFVVLAFAVAVNGAIILWHRPENRLGWVLCGTGLVGAAEHLAGSYGAAAIYGGELPLGLFAVWVFAWLETFHLGPLATVVLLLFPTGVLPSRRWRPVLWAALASFIAIAAGLAFLPQPIPILGPPNPLGRPDLAGALGLLVSVGFALLAVSALLSALSIFLRYRRSSGVERQQIKWVAFASTVTIGAVVAIVVVGLPIGVAALVATLAAVPLPTAMTIAIVRYRLYDIDTLIKRTIVYAATTAAIAATFFGGIVALQPALRPLTAGSDLAIAGSTLASFALFQPIRGRVQDAVDRRFDRARYDAAKTLEAFADRLRDEVDIDAVRTDLLAAVRGSMAPAHASLWLRGPRAVTISGHPTE